MIFLNIIIVLVNIFILLVSYFVLKQKFDSRYLNKMVLDSAKKELNNFMRSINDATLNNCNVIEAKVEDLKKIIEKADDKILEIENLLKMEINKSSESMANENQPISKKTVVSPNKMLASYRKRNQTSENYPLGQEEIESLILFLCSKNGFNLPCFNNNRCLACSIFLSSRWATFNLFFCSLITANTSSFNLAP